MKKKTVEEKIEVDEKQDLKWSKKRIAVATGAVLGIIGMAFYFATIPQDADKVLGVDEKQEEPQIELPTQREVERIVENAQESLSNIDVNDVVTSQPQIQQVIKELEKISGGENDIKDIVCQTVCK